MIYSSPWTNLFLLMAIKMVLCGAVAGAGDAMANVTRVRRSVQHHPQPHRMLTREEMKATAAWKRSHWQEMQTLLRHDDAKQVECCPSVLEMVEKKGGKTPNGLYVDLYENGDNKQQFYELSCAPGVVDKPCRFVDHRLYNHSRCVQKYSYSYALVRCSDSSVMPQNQHKNEGYFPVPGSGGCSMDYVQVRAGCECQITPPKFQSHNKRHNKSRNKRKDLNELKVGTSL